MRTNSSRPWASVPSRDSTRSTPMFLPRTAWNTAWITSPANRPPACSAAIPTGADPSGSPPTICWLNRCRSSTITWAMTFRWSVPLALGMMNLWEVAAELSRRMTAIFLRDADGARPVHGANSLFRDDPNWRDLVLFYEYFHGDNGSGLGASHQTGWTGLVGKLMQQSGEPSKHRTAARVEEVASQEILEGVLS